MMAAKQQTLFGDALEPWEEDDAAEQLVATVVFPTGPAQEFDYTVPDRLADVVQAGQRLSVPFGRGNRPVEGYCVRVESRAVGSRRLKAVSRVVDERTLLSPAMLRLTRWIADYYLCPWGQVFEAVVPAGVRNKAGTRKQILLSLSDEAREQLATLKLSKKQREVLSILAEAAEPLSAVDLARTARCTLAPVTALKKRGLLRVTSRRVAQPPAAKAPVARTENLVLNEDQSQALAAVVAAIHSQQPEVLLLHGVTGSGKTEVYIRAIQEVVGFGRQAIVLVPEISLTPQTVERFRARFASVAILHSHQGDAERHWHWEQIASGKVQVVVGARSAVFAPTPHLGLIVVDEEHETTFKQETAPRYHARDVALRRADDEGIPVLLGSATPSLEAWHRARAGTYRLLEMPRRVFGRPLPGVGTIDLASEPREATSRGALSRPLVRAMQTTLGEGGQVILLLNRRGFATHLQCPACAAVIRCPHCDIALTHHRHEEIALCHYCDYQMPAPQECPACRFAGIRYRGLGTQRLEAEVRARFPNHRCLRMDTDAMQGPGAHERALAAFRTGEVHILLGTQMIAKGLDFPNVTLVGVVNADTALHLPDFRAAERTFQLLAQVAGRTGRGEKGGRVLIQTLNPHHPAIEAAVRHDYEAFALPELESRMGLGYPPFGALVRIVVRGPRAEPTRDFGQQLAGRLRTEFERQSVAARVLGPAPAPIARLRGMVRYQIQIQSPQIDPLRAGLVAATASLEPPEEIQWIADVDPQAML